jgi:hypothetical protein
MGVLGAHGIDVTLPAGWDGHITVRDDGTPTAAISAAGAGVVALRSHPVVHLANFGLPPAPGDFGSGAVELMGDRDVFVVLFEYEASATTTALFRAHGIPRSLTSRDFQPATLRRGIPGQSAHQAFFQEGGRAFCLYVVLGAHARRAALVPMVNRVLATVRITPATAG